MQRIEAAIDCAIRSRKYGALTVETFELARSQAKLALEKGLTPFPVVVKDCYAVADIPMTCASKMLERYIPPYTATIVRRLVDKGGCIIGKGNMDEFCMGTSSALGHFGPVKNAITGDVDSDWFVPGGSSGGPAVAVQLGIADIGLGSDTGGSSRNPAAFTGIFGLKPTYGILSRYGLVPLVNSLDVPSILANSAKSCWMYLEYMLGIDDKDATSINLPPSNNTSCSEGLRVGVPKEYHNEFLTEDAWRVWNHAANILQQQGATIHSVALPHTKYSLLCYQVLSAGDIASNMARFTGIGYGYRSSNEKSTFDLYSASRTESLNVVVRQRIMAGNFYLMRENREAYFDCALRVRKIIASEIWEALKTVDILLTPSAKGPPIRFSELRERHYEREEQDDFYTQPANLAGTPAISVPCGKTSDNLPIGVQLIGNHFQDKLICDVGQSLYDAIQRS
ncbi:putative aspartyl/glutamyl-tRNA amidotransferase subunit A [Dictyocaulus viviparus]|uniref:Putative aspartyl/glutamyl-tRNA amidotransferase subunit A n=1 Tax=Dictyocaulus viviparus TaxID=29172 RepID=A0A0D8XR58_DICVI|nr:putative aspartyl/glutamyl-tRNA amidotransferase subunit A [Dictyocaulus viviparus]